MKKLLKILICTFVGFNGAFFALSNTTAETSDYVAVIEEYTTEVQTEVYENSIIETETEFVIIETEPETTTVKAEETTQEQTTNQEYTEVETTTECIEICVAPPTEETKIEYTDVVYKDSENTYTFNTLDDAMKNIHVQTLSSSEAKNIASSNKNVYKNYIDEMIELINEYRLNNSLNKLSYSDVLTDAAMERAAESAYADWNMTAYENGVKRHIRPNFEKASSIASEYGITGNFAENYARYFKNPEDTLNGWKGSSSHNKILISDKYSTIGIGIAPDSEGNLYWIALFN